MPISVLQPTSVIKINFSFNKIEVIPRSIGQFANLKYLLLENNLIKLVPVELEQLKALSQLKLGKWGGI